MPHYLNLRHVFDVDVELAYLEPIEVTAESNRRELARQAEDMIRAEYHRGRALAPEHEQVESRAAASRG